MTSIRTLMARHIAVPAKSLVKREPTKRLMGELLANEMMTREQMVAYQAKRLRELLVSVSRHVPFYRDEARRLGLRPESDDPWTVLRRLPTIDKARYRELGAALISDTAREPPSIGHTSGTTGERLEIRVDRAATQFMYLAGMRGRRWWGIQPGDPEFKVWATGRETARTGGEWLLGVLKAAKEFAVGVELVSPFLRDDTDLERAAQRLEASKPALIFGYANSIHLIAAYMARKGRRIGGPGWPKAVVFTAESLSAEQKATMTRVYGAPVVSEYGSCEAGVMAYECPSGTLHTMDDIVALETLDGEVPVASGEPGEIVVTNLLATDYPLIRYRQADLATRSLDSCDCGRPFGAIRDLTGRMNDVLRSPSGGIIDFIVFDKLMKDQPAVRRFKVVEKMTGDLVLLFETYDDENWSPRDRERFFEQARALLPDDVRIEPRRVVGLPVEPRGKFRVILKGKDAAEYLNDAATRSEE